ncbi:Chromodomain-helicase-DNA-binding protein [Echinococcus granulosus]|uniref:Chromodomain-helicase-DNA-binding protein n=1 Tax=Echinococcus granulosus TaxID=6210 RepID=W6VAX0_ECHGR|nr:Chromodomain-helicase-DNA-binding protein [Echinococcus granulosus]EUB63929.1 Chromodomain-helicase-DNA-binding protein [Echinococcus granulosus]
MQLAKNNKACLMEEQENQADDAEANFTEAASSRQDIPPVSVDENSVASASELSTASDIASRRCLRRSRRMAHNSGSFVTEMELEALFTEPSEQPVTESSGRGNAAEGIITEEYETWVEVEQILKVRRTAPFPEIPGHQSWGDRVEQYAHFVKFRDQSYWHCNWIPGSAILRMHPGMAKYFHRRNADLIDLADEEYRKEIRAADEAGRTDPPKIPSSDEDVDESAVDVSEPKTTPIAGGSFALNLLKLQPKWGCRRYEYYLKNGVLPTYLYPERVLSISEVFRPTIFAPMRRKLGSTHKSIKKSSLTSMTRLREILVKWCDLDEAHATWETVEVSLTHLDTMLPRYRRAGLQPLDPCGRRLLPSFVRRWILQLADAHLSQVASLYTLHLGEATREQIIKLYQGLSKPPPPSPPSNWEENWIDKQPSYLSKWEGGRLHSYQMEGVRWLRKSFYNHINTILADEMGLGKTVQIVAMLYSLVQEDKRPGPFLIVAPLAVTMNWKREFAFWAPEMQVIVYTGDRQNRAMINEYCLYANKASCIPAFHVMITSYEMISLERTNLMGFIWQVLVVDEAHRLKNKQSRLFRDLLSYDVEFKILLTGTPLQNNLDELIHLLHFLDPRKFSDVQALSAQWSSMSKEERAEDLQITLKDHLLRRMKRDVIKDLPKKTEIIVLLSLTPLQKRTYKMVLTKNYEALRTRNLMNPLLHLQKICNHPYLMPSGEAMAPRVPAPPTYATDTVYEPRMLVESSAKLHLVMRMLRHLRDRGHRVLIFSHLVSMLDLIQIALYNEGFEFERLDGTVRGIQRQSAIDRFNSHGAAPFVFLLSTRAGGEGINLASADTVILFDSDWNPFRDMQALARAHRIGQSKHVLIYRLIMRDTVEERIIHVARCKLALTKIMDEDRAAEAVEISALNSTPAKSNEEKRHLLRLSRSEAHDILRTGLDGLFASDDGEYGEIDASGKDQAVMKAKDDKRKLGTESGVLIYDDGILERLLDRDALSRVKETSETIEACAGDFDSPPIVFSPCLKENVDASAQNYQDGDKHYFSTDAKEPTMNEREMSEFWEALLKKRYERMLMQEEQEMSQGNLGGGQDPRGTTEDSMIIIEDSDDSDPGHHPPIEGGGTAATTATSDNAVSEANSDSVEIVNWTSGSGSLLCSAASATATKSEAPEPSNDMEGLIARRRRSTRRVRPTALSLSAYHFITRADEDDDNDGYGETSRTPRNNRRSRRSGTATAAESDEEFRPDSGMSSSSDEVEPNNNNDAREVPTNDSALRDSHENQSRSRRRREHGLRGGAEEDFSRSPPGEEESQMADMYRQVDWQTDTTAMCSPLRDLLADLPEDVRFEDNKMTVFGFNAHERQLFLESVMRYGIPPKGTLPPPEWLPFTLRSKPPEELFGYTNLFMRHLYSDPKVLDAEALRWSDGVPTEGVSGVAVLSRIAMMALIRAKAVQFEECVAVPKKFKQTADDTFRFDIYDGGLTLLSSLWQQDMDQLSARFKKLRSSLRTTVAPAASAPRSPSAVADSEPILSSMEMAETGTSSSGALSAENRALSVILRKWHNRHDYMLLAGIHTYGYAAFGDILKDKRFSMLLLGLAERVLPPERADPLAECVSNSDVAKEMRETHIFSPEVLCFLTDRLRMLEHALMVEQALAAVVLAVQGQTQADKSPDPPESLVQENTRLLVKLSKCLAKMGPIKRIKVPNDPEIASGVKRAVFDLHLLLEDLYADMPGLPAVLVCDGVDYAQPRFLIEESTIPQQGQQQQPPPIAAPTSPSSSTVLPLSTSRSVQPTVAVRSRSSAKVVEVLLDSE